MHSSSEEGFHSTSSTSGGSGPCLTIASSPSSSDYAGLHLGRNGGAAAAAAQLQQQQQFQAALEQVDVFQQHMFPTPSYLRGSESMLSQYQSQSSLHQLHQHPLASLGLTNERESTGPRSDSGASSGADNEGSDKGMKEERLPGAWFYENGENGNNSPLHDDEYGLRAALCAKNITETVEVPTSEHVAEIVGRQGCKIKALRAKTNTYIKTPIRGEDPIFTVTGTAADVAEAKTEIKLAADHFTQQVRTCRKSPGGGVPGMNAPGHITAYVRVPLRVVGLVVGPKGATIKRIQQDTSTYIITPSREREPIFEVTGLPANVEVARKEIEQHIFQRTGNMPITDPSSAMTSAEMQSVLQGAAARAKFTGVHQNGAVAAAAFAAAAARHFGPAAAAADHASMYANEQFQMQSILQALSKGDGTSLHGRSTSSPHSLFRPSLPSAQHMALAAQIAAARATPRVNSSTRSSTSPSMGMTFPPPFSIPPPSSSTWSAPLGIVTSSTSNVMASLSSSDSASCDWGNGGGMSSTGGWSMAMPPPAHRGGVDMLGTRLQGMNLMPRDEGLGDSPPTTNQLGGKDYSMMSSIWASSDVENTVPKRVDNGLSPVGTA